MSAQESTDAGPAGSGTQRRDSNSVLRSVVARREFGVLIGVILLFLIVAATRPDIFFEWDRMGDVTTRVFRRATPYIVIGIGMSFLIIGGEFDLSVGSMYAVGGISFGLLLTDYSLSVPLALVAVLLIGAAVGATNGVITTKIGVPSLIVTIGMLSILRGVALYITPAGSQQLPDDAAFLNVFGGTFNALDTSIAYQVFWAIALMIVFGFVLQRTRFGYHVYATGDDVEAAEMTGINVDRVKILNFILTGALAAFAGILGITYFGSMFGTAGRGFELYVIAAVVIGGTNLFGGRGSLTGTFLGATVIAVIPTVLVLNGFAVETEEMLTGIVIIAAVVIDILTRDD